MVQLGSFVFFDLETTGLPEKSKPPKTTEISLVACSKQHLLDAEPGGLPRVLHKLTVCLNPVDTIHPKAAEISGLTNDLLMDEAVFDEDMIKLIELFLERLQKPVCLVAHNGDSFDFIILRKQLQALNAVLSDTVHSIDSLQLFRALDQNTQRRGYKLVQIYERLFGRAPSSAHYAEADVKTLFKCATANKRKFVKHAEDNCTRFRDFSRNF